MQSTWTRAARAHLIGSGLATALMLAAGMAAPSMAQEGFSEDLGIIKACGSDIWSLCSDVLPEVGGSVQRPSLPALRKQKVTDARRTLA